MTAAEQALTEIDAQAERMKPEHEGLRDYTRLNLEPATQQEVRVALNRYDRRLNLLKVAREAVSALVADGPAGITIQEVTAAVYADLKAQQDTITAALHLFGTPNTDAARMDLTAGAEEPKRP